MNNLSGDISKEATVEDLLHLRVAVENNTKEVSSKTKAAMQDVLAEACSQFGYDNPDHLARVEDDMILDEGTRKKLVEVHKLLGRDVGIKFPRIN